MRFRPRIGRVRGLQPAVVGFDGVVGDAGYQTVNLADQFHRENHRHVVVYDEACIRDNISVTRAGVAQGEVRMPATVTAHATGVSTTTPVPEGPRQLARAAAHPDADELLVLIGSGDTLGWDTLRKVMEIVKTDVGGKAALIATGWVTTTEFDEFGYAANEPQASGDDARHARRPPKTPPARIVTIEEGRQFIRDLARHWLDSLP